jgi:hypothetical protein
MNHSTNSGSEFNSSSESHSTTWKCKGKAARSRYVSRPPTEIQLATWEWIFAQAELIGPMLGIPVRDLRSWAAGELQDVAVLS